MSPLSDPRFRLISEIHHADLKVALAITGGGSPILSDLLTVPGASRSVVSAFVPYSTDAMEFWLGGRMEQFCAAETAKQMAVRAWLDNRKFVTTEPFLAVSCTAALRSERPKRGDHRAYIALQSNITSRVVSVNLAKNERTRAEEERLIADLILGLIHAQAVSDSPFSQAESLAEFMNVYGEKKALAEDRLEVKTITVDQKLSKLLLGELDCIANRDGHAAGVLMSGSFNPLHQGHLAMCKLAEKRYDQPVDFELSIRNADKPPLDFLTLDQRLEQFQDQKIWLTNAPTFVEKSRLFPGRVFVVGVDTLIRIADGSFYDGPEGFKHAIDTIKSNGCRFFVVGREANQKFLTVDNIELPNALLDLCDWVDESEFRVDISSTSIRQKKKVDFQLAEPSTSTETFVKMEKNNQLIFQTDSLDGTEQFAKLFGDRLRTILTGPQKQLDCLSICLTGSLGAGKTTWVRALVAGLGVSPDEVSSPTFSLQQQYDADFPITHFDFYRLESHDEVDEIGFEETVNQNGLHLIEWGEKFAECLPENHLQIRIESPNSNCRQFFLHQIGGFIPPGHQIFSPVLL